MRLIRRGETCVTPTGNRVEVIGHGDDAHDVEVRCLRTGQKFTIRSVHLRPIPGNPEFCVSNSDIS